MNDDTESRLSGAGATVPEAQETEPAPPLPDDALVIVPVRGTVLFPGVVMPLTLGRKRSIAAAQEAVRSKRPIGFILQREAMNEEPAPADLFRVGTVAAVLRYVTGTSGVHHVICEGEQRFRTIEYLPGYPYFVARVERVGEPAETGTEIEARVHQLRKLVDETMELLPEAPEGLGQALAQTVSAASLADMVASFLDLTPEEKQDILETFDLQARLDKILEKLTHRLEVMRLSDQIGKQTKAAMDERQREFLLREQLKTIQRELGEDQSGAEVEELRNAITEAKMPAEAEEHARKELARLEHMPEAAAEYGMIRTYLDWLIELPWSKLSEETIDINAARATLERDHYGLEKVKKRILEYLAVRKLNPEGRSPILCFVGPPGVGKTSLGQSIARAMGLEFVRQSLGGVHDEAEIRGHRRTYIGALPGNIIQGIRKAGTRNPVFMLDEMDKLGAGFQGDPSSALLEVLDPEQNNTFRDNYLAVPFDLSKVFFIGTANVLDSIPGPLRDRMEVISLPGYTENEKLQIARRYLVERQLQANGLRAEQLEITDAALTSIIRDYTREAGCRNLEREIGAVCRHAAVQFAEGRQEAMQIDAPQIQDILGPRQFESEVAMRTSVPGVATGLAWTPAGGDILFVEATRVPGKGGLILTGQLGDVMKESAQAALSLVKGRTEALGIASDLFEKSDIHIHVPAGAIPKDGPSAGVAIYIALVSLLTGKTTRTDTAMTGEISLRGLVLPVGGIKEKAVAAVMAGITRLLMPARNRKDLEDIPQDARDRVQFVWLESVDDAVRAALEDVGDSSGTLKRA
ncbi:MAG: endopeptidase La [Thiogranum sp.]|nr:endopeptidase La [Thiogranum sp.]